MVLFANEYFNNVVIFMEGKIGRLDPFFILLTYSDACLIALWTVLAVSGSYPELLERFCESCYTNYFSVFCLTESAIWVLNLSS
jgi:hypothetical protein